MSRVKSQNTRPEILVRSLLHENGYRFRIHRKDLPGSPDIVLPKYRKVIFINGCLWHGHDCSRGKQPQTNSNFWASKIQKNIERDNRNYHKLKDMGWQVIIVWSCQLTSKTKIEDTITELIKQINNV